jgi:hypothetical protein
VPEGPHRLTSRRAVRTIDTAWRIPRIPRAIAVARLIHFAICGTFTSTQGPEAASRIPERSGVHQGRTVLTADIAIEPESEKNTAHQAADRFGARDPVEVPLEHPPRKGLSRRKLSA